MSAYGSALLIKGAAPLMKALNSWLIKSGWVDETDGSQKNRRRIKVACVTGESLL